MGFSDFLGNESLKQRLRAGNNHFSHCYILEGPSGSGKKTLAKLLSAAMECQSSGELPCGQCPSCRKALKNEHPDIITVDSDTATIPIRLIRDMQADAYILPNEGKRKIYLLPRAQDMQAPAQNALLKLLEEPPAYCAFILMTDSMEKLLETVRSRAVTLTLSPLSREQLYAALVKQEPKASPEELARAMDKSEGYLGAALSLLHSPETALDRQVEEILSAFAAGDSLQLLTALLPLEKQKRQELLELLTDLNRCLVRAMAPGSVSSAQTKTLSGCTQQQLFHAAQAVSYAITLLQANGSAGHAVGSLLAQMQPSR